MDPNPKATRSDRASSSGSVHDPNAQADWRSQFQQDARQESMNRIMDAIKRLFPMLGFKNLAAKIEENAFNVATSASDYLRKIHLKLLAIEKKAQQAPRISPSPKNSLHNQYEIDQGLMSPPLCLELSLGNPSQSPVMPMMIPSRSFPGGPTGPAGGPSSGAGPALEANPGWRSQLPRDTRLSTVKKLVDTLKRHFPAAAVPEALSKLQKVAVRCEEKIYNTAISQPDYVRKITLMTLSMTNKQPGLNPSLPNQNRFDQAASLDLTAQMGHPAYWLKNEQQLSPLQQQQQLPQAGILSNQSQLRALQQQQQPPIQPQKQPLSGAHSNQAPFHPPQQQPPPPSQPQQHHQKGAISNQAQLPPHLEMALSGESTRRVRLHECKGCGSVHKKRRL